MLPRWPVFKEGEWSCYGGGKINKGRMTMLETWSV